MGRVVVTGNERTRTRTAALAAAGGGSSALATGGTLITDTPTLVEHEFSSGGTFTLIRRGVLDVAFTITGTGTFDGVGSSGSDAVGVPATVTVTSGTVTVAYDPSTDWDPGNPDGYLDIIGLWFDASDAATITDAGSGAVSQWDDKSANGFDVVQATGAARPTTGVESQNGLNTISFDGGDHLMGSAFTLDAFVGDEITCIYLLKEDRTNAFEGIVGLKSSGANGLTGFQMWRRQPYPALTFGIDGTFGAGNYRENRALGDNGHTAAYRVHTAQVSKANNTYRYRISGAASTLTTESGSAAASSLFATGGGDDFNLVIGANFNGTSDTGVTQNLDGKIGFIIVLNAAATLDDLDLAALEQWHRTKWGVA